jgi:hypothetical protein
LNAQTAGEGAPWHARGLNNVTQHSFVIRATQAKNFFCWIGAAARVEGAAAA